MANYLASIITSTLNNLSEARKVYDQTFEKRLLLYMLKQKGMVKSVNGGLNIVQNLQVSANDTVDWRDPYVKIPVRQQDPLTRVSYPWASLSGSVPIFGFDEVVNKGEAAIVDFAETLRQNLIDTLNDTLGAGLFGDGTAEWGLQGLLAMISASNTYPVANDKQQIPGINRATTGNEYWQATMLNTDQAWSLDDSSTTDMGWSHAYKHASGGHNTDTPDLIYCDWNAYSWYESMLVGMKQEHDPKLADAGFENLRYKNAVVVWDDDLSTALVDASLQAATDGGTLFLNTKYIRLRPDSENVDKFVFETAKNTEEYDPGTYIVKAAWRGQMTCTRPARLAMYANKTAPA